jgi:hypothetical protein
MFDASGLAALPLWIKLVIFFGFMLFCIGLLWLTRAIFPMDDKEVYLSRERIQELEKMQRRSIDNI